MGGFTFNGTGWGDSFYPQKDLGKHYCYDCRSIQEFSLMEVKSKVKILYIPTVSFRTRYAVGCKKCKSGYFVGEDVVNDLLYDRLSIEVAKDQIYFHTVAASGTGEKQEKLTQLVQALHQRMEHMDSGQGKGASGTARPDPQGQTLKCQCCGAALKPHQLFCASCGLRVK